MINSHKEFIAEIKNFAIKFPLIKGFSYLKDVDGINEEISNTETRTIVLGLDSLDFDDEDYNIRVTYLFAMADETLDDTDSIIDSESENIFCVSALSDYLNHIAEAETDFSNVVLANTANIGKVFTTISGKFSFVIKRNPSYWKKMEEYND